MSPADLARFGRRLSSVDPQGSGLYSCVFLCLQVGSFRSKLLFNGNGCCSGALVLYGLSTTTSRVSTTISFAQFQGGRGDDGDVPSSRSVLVIIARWSMDLDVIFIISGIRYTIMVDDE